VCAQLTAPELAVVMPIAPNAEWLRECVDSLRDQTFADWELVAVLDGACPDNRRTLREADLGSRLRIVELSSPVGVAQALNAGMRSTHAPLVARMDADDICRRDRFEKQVSALRHAPNVWVLGTSATVIDELGREVGVRTVPTGTGAVRRGLLWRNMLVHPSVVMRRPEVLSLGGYNVQSDRMQDYELWLRVAAVAELDNLADPLLRYRIHPQQHSRGPRLGQTRVIRTARRGAVGGLGAGVRSDVRHLIWLAAQHWRERRKVGFSK
jgi:glycosyltransferase involved in cell wall biosynthesis